MHQRRLVRSWLLLLAALPAAAPSASVTSLTSASRIDESVRVERAHWPVLVRPHRTRPDADVVCAGLAPSQVEVTLDGAPLRVTAVGPRPLPRIHALLIDTSNSMVESDRLLEARRAAEEYIDWLPPEDRILVASFDESLVLRAPLTRDKRRAREAVASMETGTFTALWDALYYLVLYLETLPGEKVVVLLTDGEDSSSLPAHDFETVLARAASTPDLIVFSVGIKLPRLLRVGVPTARGKLGRLAERTGGQFFDVRQASEIMHRFRRIRQRLDERVYVSYVPPPPAEAGEKRPGRLEVRGRPQVPCRLRSLRRPRATSSARAAPSASLERRPLAGAGPGRVSLEPPAECAAESRTPVPVAELRRAEAAAARPADGAFFLPAGDAWLLGRAVDLLVERGPAYRRRAYRQTRRLKRTAHAQPLFVEREIALALPPLSTVRRELQRPETVLRFLLEQERCAPRAPAAGTDARAPVVVHGQTFLELRELIGRVLFEVQGEYRDWARERAAGQARLEWDAMRDRLSPAVAPLAEDADLLLQALVERAADPREGRPHAVLAEWLGDVGAREVVLSLERELANELLRAPPGDDAARDGLRRLAAAWPALDRWFPPALGSRILTPLVPAWDAQREVIGFYRFLLDWPEPLRRDAPVLPRRPLSLALLERVLEDEAAARLLRGGVEVARVGYDEPGRRELRRIDCAATLRARAADGGNGGAMAGIRVTLELALRDGPAEGGFASLSGLWPSTRTIGAEPGEPACFVVEAREGARREPHGAARELAAAIRRINRPPG